MKKLLSISIVFLAIIALSGCKGNSPSAVIEESCQCLMDSDYVGYVEYIALDENATPEEIEKQKAGLADMLKSKLTAAIKEKGGLKSCKVLSEEINEEAKTAVVKFEVTYGDGTTEQEEQKMKQNKDGKWLMDVGK